jgi:hypothetical protein
MKPLHPLFKVFGSKWSSSKHYPAPIEGLRIYEPFAGSAGYSLRHHDFPVTIYEINPHLSYLWQWLINSATSQDVLDIPLNIPEGTDIRDLGKDLSHGQMLLLKNWQRTNNCGSCWTISKWGSLPGQFTANTRARVADEIHAIKHWKFEPVTWTESGTYFCDSPYFYNYKYGIKDFDFDAYAANVGRVPPNSIVIACEAVCPKTGKIPDYLPFQPSHSQVTSRRKASNNHHSKELVYVRYT